jgi:outer membrane protein OmpA-like peptidoglycan-associated protein
MRFISMKKTLSVLIIGCVLLSWGCATKKFVRQEISLTNQKVAQVDAKVQENDKWIKEHEAKIQQLSADTQKALADVKTAMSKAEEAATMARGKLLYGIALKNDAIKFDFNSAKINDDAKKILEEFIGLVKTENKNVFIEIHGHTDGTGPEEYNLTLGQKRADTVKRCLFDNGIPLHKLNTISYGSSQPVGDNANRAGRAANRRVVILVLE